MTKLHALTDDRVLDLDDREDVSTDHERSPHARHKEHGSGFWRHFGR